MVAQVSFLLTHMFKFRFEIKIYYGTFSKKQACPFQFKLILKIRFYTLAQTSHSGVGFVPDECQKKNGEAKIKF